MTCSLPLPPLSLPIPHKPWNAIGKKLESQVRKALFDHQLLKGIDQVAVALSGGKDSLALLFLLHAINGKGHPPFSLHALHITGAFSCGAGISLPLLKAICHKLSVPLEIIEQKKPEKLECYSCSRERRRLLFDAAKSKGIHTLAFGHHKDDNLQTLLMNLLHKAEFEPLHPKVWMQRFEVGIIRPLCYSYESEIEAFAKRYGFARVTCQCPVGQNSMRKKTAKLLKEMEEYFPHSKTNLFQASQRWGSQKALNP